MQRNRPGHDARVVERDVQRPAAEVRLAGAPREARRGLRAGRRCERQERRERDGQEREREQRSGDGAVAGARAEHRTANRRCMRRIWRLAGPIVNASRTRRPLNWTLRFSAILDDMSTGERHLYGRNREAEQLALQREWRRLTRAATFVAVLTSPVTFAFFYVAARLAAPVGARRHVRLHHRVPRLPGRARAPSHPAREHVRRGPRARRGGHRLAAARLVLAHEVPPSLLARDRRRRRARLHVDLRDVDPRHRRASSSPRCRCSSSTASSCRCCSSATC